MQTINEAATEFLAKNRIAVTGVSRNAKGHGSNAVYKRLRSRGYDVLGINVIDGGCPLMFDPTADFGHKCMKTVFTLTRKVPRQV